MAIRNVTTIDMRPVHDLEQLMAYLKDLGELTGRHFSTINTDGLTVTLNEETLSDGSKVYDLEFGQPN